MQANKLILSLVSIYWSVMITALSTISLLLGTTIAYVASDYPERRAAMETMGGILLLGGLGLMGYALEAVLGCPLPEKQPANRSIIRETRRGKLGHRLAIKKNLTPAAFRNAGSVAYWPVQRTGGGGGASQRQPPSPDALSTASQLWRGSQTC
jgi:hypothetical protein